MQDNLSDALLSAPAAEVYQKIREEGGYIGETLDAFSADEQAFLIGELFVRTSRYGEIAESLPETAGVWWRRMAVCTGYLFTAPGLALGELDFLESGCPNAAWALRLKAWRMHLNLLIGFEPEGKALRDEVIAATTGQSPWYAEITTLLAISYFSTGESKKAIECHYHCFRLLKDFPEQYFKTFGAAIGMRAALKICDAEAFEHFSQQLDEALQQTPDSRYQLRQLSYRAVILTQLGERDLAHRYWIEGDSILESVDQGSATVERAQYLIFRLLAASLLGDQRRTEKAYQSAIAELHAAKVYEVHLAELEICYRLAPLANPVLRGKDLGRSYRAAVDAVAFFEMNIAEAKLDSVRTCYVEAKAFCEGLLDGKIRRQKRNGHDRWRTLTLSIIDNYQNFADFAEQIDYFRLLPKFIHELQGSSLTDQGLQAALARVVKFTPRLTERGFEVAFQRGEISRISQVEILFNFANTLRSLYKENEESSRSRMLAETVQTVAHDFRRPFNLLRMTLEAMQMMRNQNSLDQFPSLLDTAIPTINRACQEVNRLLEDVLDTTRPIALTKVLVKPSEVVGAAIETLKLLNPRSNFKIRTDYRNDQPLVADGAKLIRAMTNILENATQATPADEIWVKTARETVDGCDATSFTIGNGSYISREDRKRLFEKYFSKGKCRGTGLGLFISKKIVGEHGGVVRCRSSRRHGTEFDLVVPTEPQLFG